MTISKEFVATHTHNRSFAGRLHHLFAAAQENDDWVAFTPYMHPFGRILRFSYSSTPKTAKLSTAIFRAFTTGKTCKKYQLSSSAVTMASTTGKTGISKTGQVFERLTLDSLLRRRLFYTPAFEIYGGVSGLYDYGPQIGRAHV